MMLDLNALREQCTQGSTFEYLCFWGHQPAKDGSITTSCFSQWYAATFTINGHTYWTAEQWMMAEKARLFEDRDSLTRILESGDPKTAKALGRKVKEFDETTWKAHARQIVTEGNLAKFQQNSPLKDFLLATGGAVIVEASPYDRIWGIGLKADDKRAQHPATWQGQNLLGFALMDVREQLQ